MPCSHPALSTFALTSPPYYDVEKYEGEESSWKLYPTFGIYCVDGFYSEADRQRREGPRASAQCLALQVGSQSYPLTDTAIKIAPEFGLEYVETRSTSMRNTIMGTDLEVGECIVILRKKV